ncbi:FUN14 family [Microdochium nivale]|nr:FUN14 family [Microdochium nivale]
MSARLILSRTARATIRSHAYGAGIGLSVFGAAGSLQHFQQKNPLLARKSPSHYYLFDSAGAAASPGSRAFSSNKRDGDEKLDPELLSQLSRGSITGFLAGMLLSMFSKTLVLFGGVVVVLTQVAARYGIDIVHQLKLKQRISNSRVLSALERDPVFKVSFGFFFAMSAFIGF